MLKIKVIVSRVFSSLLVIFVLAMYVHEVHADNASEFKAICISPTDTQRITIDAFYVSKTFEGTCEYVQNLYINNTYKDTYSLSLSSGEVTDLSPLRYMSKIKELAISDNKITDLTPIKNLKYLE